MERRNQNILIALIAVVIILAVFSSFGLPLFASPTPSIVLPTPVPSDQEQAGVSNRQEGTLVEVTPDTVQSVIAALNRLGSYSRTVTTSLEGAVSTAKVWVDGGWVRTDMTLPTGLEVHTIIGGGRLWRWYGEERTAASWAADGAAEDIDGQRIPTYEDVLALNKSAITAAGYEEKEGFPCVYAEVSVPQLDQVERYWVSAESGLLTAAETVCGGEVVYAMTAGAPEVPVPTTASFVLPDGTVLHTVGE